MPLFYAKFVIFMLATWIALAASTTRATETSTWNQIGSKTEDISHDTWQTLLDRYIVERKADDVPLNLFRYGAVTDTDKNALQEYLDTLQAIDPRDYSRPAQFAYWVNLYNALTINLILDNYPVKSIRKLGPFFSIGPWGQEIATVAGESLTLDDIEHKILRPIWKDPRVHYAVNCASMGCPNLSKIAFTAENKERLLNNGAMMFIHHPRGVNFDGNKLIISKIYKWFDEDFGNSEAGILDHLQRYAKPELKEKLRAFNGNIRYAYDWDLNEPNS